MKVSVWLSVFAISIAAPDALGLPRLKVISRRFNATGVEIYRLKKLASPQKPLNEAKLRMHDAIEKSSK